MRCIVESLALKYRYTIELLADVTGNTPAELHIVGGGSRNAYLNQATADACGKPVLAGPVEATAAGNVIVQAVAAGSLSSIAEGRLALTRGLTLSRFEPRGAG